MKKLDRKKIYIYQNDVPKSYEARQQFTDEVTKRGYTIVDSYDETVGLITCIGGDGTFLRLVHACDFPTSPIIGINTGHLGFFQEILPEDISGFLDSYEKQEYTLQSIWPIDAIIDTVNGTYQLRGVNEIVIRGPHTHLTHLGIEIDRFPGTGILRRRAAGFHLHGIHRLQLCFGRCHHSSAAGCAADHPNRTVQHQCLPMLSFQHPLSGQHDHAYDAD